MSLVVVIIVPISISVFTIVGQVMRYVVVIRGRGEVRLSGWDVCAAHRRIVEMALFRRPS